MTDEYSKTLVVHDVESYKIGVMVDLPNNPGCSDLFVEALDIAFKEYLELGICTRPVELIVREYVGHPWKSGKSTIDTYRDLVENEGVIGVAGPMTTDNSLSLVEELDRLKVPSISICGSMEYVGPYAFSLPNGGMAEEPMVLASGLKDKGYKKIALIRETPSQIGEEYTRFFRYAAQTYGLEIELEQGVDPIASEEAVATALIKLRHCDAEALVYFGLGRLSGRLTKVLMDIDWDPPRFMGTAFVGAAYHRENVKRYEGWVGLDQIDESNPVFQHLMDLYQQKSGEKLDWPTSPFTCGYDIGRIFAIALNRMRISTGPALKQALETICRLPAATGAKGTVVGFSAMDHRGFKGADYLLFRAIKDGQNVFVGTAPVN